MSYSKKMYNEVEKIIYERRQHSIEQQEKSKKEIYNVLPQISKIDKEVSKTSIDVAKEI